MWKITAACLALVPAAGHATTYDCRMIKTAVTIGNQMPQFMRLAQPYDVIVQAQPTTIDIYDNAGKPLWTTEVTYSTIKSKVSRARLIGEINGVITVSLLTDELSMMLVISSDNDKSTTFQGPCTKR